MAFTGQLGTTASMLGNIELGGPVPIPTRAPRWPSLRFEINFDDNPSVEFPTTGYTDVSWRVRAFSTRRGRSNIVDRIEGGVATVLLDNRDGMFNFGEPGRLLLRRARLQAFYDGTYFPLFTGHIESYQYSYPNTDFDAVCQVTLSDGLKILSQQKLPSAFVREAEVTGNRLDAVLEEAGIGESYREIDDTLIDVDPLAPVRVTPSATADTFTLSATLTNLSATITVADTTGLAGGMAVSGIGIPAGATVDLVLSSTQFTIKNDSDPAYGVAFISRSKDTIYPGYAGPWYEITGISDTKDLSIGMTVGPYYNSDGALLFNHTVTEVQSDRVLVGTPITQTWRGPGNPGGVATAVPFTASATETLTVEKDYLAVDQALDHIRQIEATERGLFVLKADGVYEYQGVDYRPAQTVQLTFGENASLGEVPYKEVPISFDDQNLVNEYVIENVFNDTTTILTDDTSQARYFRRSQTIQQIWASNKYSLPVDQQVFEPLPRLEGIVVAPATNPTVLWRQCLDLDVSMRVDVRRRPLRGADIFSAYDQFIEGIEMDADVHDWQVKFITSPVRESSRTTTVDGARALADAEGQAGSVEGILPGGFSTPQLGFSTHLEAGALGTALVQAQAARAAGATIIRNDLAWDTTEPANGTYNWAYLDAIGDACVATGLKCVLQCGYAPTWANGGAGNKIGPTAAHIADFGDHIRQVALRCNSNYPGVFIALEPWNEPNINFLTNPANSKIGDATYYTSLVQAAYEALRGINPVAADAAPEIELWGGATTGLGEYQGAVEAEAWNWLTEALGANILDYCDGWSCHPYQYFSDATIAQLTDIATGAWGGNWSRVFWACTNGANLATRLANAGYIGFIHGTEWGAPTYSYPAGTHITDCTSEANQAGLLPTSLTNWRAQPKAGHLFFYTLKDNNSADTSSRENHFGAYRDDWSAKAIVAKMATVVIGVRAAATATARPGTVTGALTVIGTRATATATARPGNRGGAALTSSGTPTFNADSTCTIDSVDRLAAATTLLTANQGWVAARVKPSWASTAPPGFARIFEAGGFQGFYITNGWEIDDGVSLAKVVNAHAAGDHLTIIYAWVTGTIYVSVNGAAFTSAARAAVGALTEFSIGNRSSDAARPFTGDFYWLASGTGTLSDANAATINGFGDTDPAPASFPGSCTMVWPAVALSTWIPWT